MSSNYQNHLRHELEVWRAVEKSAAEQADRDEDAWRTLELNAEMLVREAASTLEAADEKREDFRRSHQRRQDIRQIVGEIEDELHPVFFDPR